GDPPPRVAEDMVTRPHPDLPPLHEVVTVPVFDRYARLISSAGYHRESQIFFDDRRRLFSDFAIPETPAPGDVARARDLLLDDLFVDFPFASVSDRAHAIAALILPFVRRMIAGPTPIHLVEAPSAGTGKTLIAECISLIFSGAPAPIMTISKQEDRVTDAITSLFQSGVQIACIDNISQRHGLDSANLAAAVTSETWSARQFHQQRMLVFPNDICWIATANNPDLSLELARRSIRIRIDSHLPRPWERDGFKHDPIKRWILENRSELVRSCLTLVAHWIAEGRPGTTRRLGSFESWSYVLGGILFAAQIPGFLENQTELYAAADNRSAEFSAFIEAWSQSEESAGARSSGDLAKFAVENNLLVESLGDASARSQSIRMGILLRENRDRVVNGFCIKMAIDGHSKAKLWALVRSISLEEGALNPAECAVCSEFDITQHTAEKSQLNLGLAECADSADRNTLYAGENFQPDNRTIGQPDTPSTRIGDIGENIPAHAAHSANIRKDDGNSAACLENAKNHHAAHTANGDDLDLSRLPDTEEDDA
ncbi:hypothetical protein K8I61_17415, partial [bacterium]|nr:hypothetical protein [bacterium]